MDGYTPEEDRIILALRVLPYEQRQALIDTILALASKHPQPYRLATIFEFRTPRLKP